MTKGADMGPKLEEAVAALRRGEFVVVVDAADREAEADLVIAAQFATPQRLGFLLRHTSGIVCVPMSNARADALELPLMVAHNTDPHGTAFTVSVDVAAGTSTGISASDRAATARALADPAARPADFVRPGHVFPLRAHQDGLRGRAGHTEASVALAELAGLTPVMVICELADADGEMVRRDDALAFAREHELALVDTCDLVAPTLEETDPVMLPTAGGPLQARVVSTQPDGLEHVVLTVGDALDHLDEPVLVRVHSECLTGDLFGSYRCDCGDQLDQALDEMRAAGRGVLVYERGHEGRGIGLADKLRAYRLQDEGADTIEANLRLGRPADARDFGPAARVLRHLGVSDVTLLTNNPAKVDALRRAGIAVQPRHLRATPQPDNVAYLRTKQAAFGHDLDLPAAVGRA
jgi:3,4-dihydroxy 2-butanone 4-phosphate synthase/GTP cyclohydrolase II